MNGQRTRKYLLSISLMILLCGNLRAGPTFRDDFSDGSIEDGSPVSWWWDDGGQDQGQRIVTGDGFSFRPNPGRFPWASVSDGHGSGAVYAGNMTIRTQFKMDSPFGEAHAGILFRGDLSGNYYAAGIAYSRLFLARSTNHQWQNLGWYTIPGYDWARDEIIVETEVTNITDSSGQRTSRLDVRAWLPGQERPEYAQISRVDDTYDAGLVGIYACDGPATFRWVEVVIEPTEPVVDFNGDGTVNIEDLLKMIHCWGLDEASVDLNGDGTVDRKDLEILMDYWNQDVNDPTLVAYWALDETVGEIASDSVGRHDGTLTGAPTWVPDGGIVGGALQLDGQDDCVVTGPVLDPAAGSFSVLAWIKGGTPGQTILSQEDGDNWLTIEPDAGCLITELKSNGRLAGPLNSQTVITDGDWHRVALVCDRVNRALYVDDILAAEDTEATLTSCLGGLNVGADKDLTPGSFFSGLIDDVRIYERAVQP